MKKVLESAAMEAPSVLFAIHKLVLPKGDGAPRSTLGNSCGDSELGATASEEDALHIHDVIAGALLFGSAKFIEAEGESEGVTVVLDGGTEGEPPI